MTEQRPKAIVTGAAGFIGSHLVDALLVHGFEVHGIDNLFSGKLENLANAKKHSQFHFHQVDIRDEKKLKSIWHGAKVVYHQAAIVSVPLCTSSPDLAKAVNQNAFDLILQLSHEAGVTHFVYASSCAVYGDQGQTPLNEKSVLHPKSLYAESKAANEKSAKELSTKTTMQLFGMRYFNVFGARQDPKGPYAGVIAKFCDLAMVRQQPTIWGTGEQSRDFVLVQDLVEILMLLLKLKGNEAKPFAVLNVASGKSVSILQLWAEILKVQALEKASWQQPKFEPKRGDDIMYSKADLTLLHELYQKCGLKYQPKTLQQGLSHLLLSKEME